MKRIDITTANSVEIFPINIDPELIRFSCAMAINGDVGGGSASISQDCPSGTVSSHVVMDAKVEAERTEVETLH